MKSGNINFIDTELTNEQFASLGYPALYILKNSSNTVTKFIIFDLNGVRTDYDTSSGGGVTEEWVNAQIATAIAGLQDNRLEYNEFSDFPATGDITKFYIDLSEDKIYIWDATSSSYKSQSWDTAAIASLQASIASAAMAFQNLQNSKLDKGGYTGTAENLKDEIDQKVNLKIFRSFNDFPPVHTLDPIENTNDFYLDRYTGEIFIVMYERANVDDPGMNLVYKKI